MGCKMRTPVLAGDYTTLNESGCQSKKKAHRHRWWRAEKIARRTREKVRIEYCRIKKKRYRQNVLRTHVSVRREGRIADDFCERQK